MSVNFNELFDSDDDPSIMGAMEEELKTEKKRVATGSSKKHLKNSIRVTLNLEESYVKAIEKCIANTKRANRTSVIEDMLDDSGFMKKWG